MSGPTNAERGEAALMQMRDAALETPVHTMPDAGLSQASNPAQIVAQRRAQAARAMEMRIAGATAKQIAETLHLSVTTVENLIQKSLLRSAEHANVTAMRELEAQRLDALLLAWTQRARTDPRAADIVLRIGERRSRLEGLDMPMRIDIGSVIAQIAANEGWDMDATMADVRQLVRDERIVQLEGESQEADTQDADQPPPDAGGEA